MRPSLTRRNPSARGYVLITVLWIGVALSLAVAAYLSSAREHGLVVRAEVASLRAGELARSGLNLALSDLSTSSSQVPRDGRITQLAMAEGSVRYSIRDETGKVDVRLAPPQLLTPVLAQIGAREGVDAFDAVNVAQALAQAAVEGTSPGSIYDALLAAGMGPAAAAEGARHLTFFGFGTRINPMTATIEVLQAVPGLGTGGAADIVARREDGRSLPQLGSAAAWLAVAEGPAYTIEAEARLNTGATARMTALVVETGQSFRGGGSRFDILSVRFER